MNENDFAALAAQFPAEAISWRVGSTNRDKTSGLALAYLDARDVMQRFDDVCGPSNWQCRYTHADIKTVCEIGVKIDGEWVWKSNGAGDTDVEGQKGALSDAFKRAAVLWGVGRYLYDLDSPWVKLQAAGRSYKIDESERGKLRAVLERHGAPPERSSQSLKRSDENGQDEWERVSGELAHELLDCHSMDGLAALRADWRVKVREMRWPKSYQAALAEMFNQHEEQLKEAA